MHQGSPPYLVLVDQMGMGLCPRQSWEGTVCVPKEVASRPCPGTRSRRGVQVGAEPEVAYVLTPMLVPGGLQDHGGEE